MDKYTKFIKQLDLFINKYYKIKFFKGLLISILSIISLFLIVSLFEYYGHNSSNVRFLLLISFILVNSIVFLYFLLVPILRFLNLIPRISFIQANDILKVLFYSIDDQIVNILELKEKLETSDKNPDLLLASIDQKVESLSTINFTTGINIRSTFFLFPYLIGIILIVGSLFLLKPKLFTESTKRIIQYNNEFDRLLSYDVFYYTEHSVNKNENLKVSIKLNGIDFPSSFYIKYGSSIHIMSNESLDSFSYTFKNVNKDFKFFIYGDDFYSKAIQVNIIEVPIIENFKAFIQYPAYINRESDELEGIYDFTVPQGTDIEFIIKGQYIDSAYIVIGANRHQFVDKRSKFRISKKFYNNSTYQILLSNQFVDTTIFENKLVNIIPDIYPSINISEIPDENFNGQIHFQIDIDDDYGITDVFFHVENDSFPVLFNSNIIKQQLYYSYDFSSSVDSSVVYYFSVFDNDKINGLKRTNSIDNIYHKESFNSKFKREKIIDKEIEEKLNTALSLANDLSTEINDLQQSLITENMDSWERNKKINDLLEKQKELNNALQLLEQLNKNKLDQNSNNSSLSDEILKKQKMLAESFDNLMDDELKALFEELQKLQQEFDIDKLHDLSKKLDKDYNELSKELDKNLERLKRYEFSKNIELLAAELDEVANQELLSKTDSTVSSLSDLKYIQHEYDSIFKENTKLDNGLDLKDFEEEFNDLSDSFDTNYAKEKEQRSKKMKELSKDMLDMLNSSSSKQEGENADNLRLLLDNLFYFSFEQEAIMGRLKYTASNNPNYLTIQKEQLKITNDYSIIRDSLYALSKRSDMIGQSISDNAFNIEKKLTIVNSNMPEFKRSVVLTNQQLILTHTNELILLLSESLKNMDQANGSGSGSGPKSKKKQKPKNGEPSVSDLRKSQEDMKSDLEKMIQDMKEGQSQGSKPGSKEMGQMLMKQEIFQQQLNDILGQDGISNEMGEKLEDIKKLSEENKRDIVNMNIGKNYQFRQQQILTRLLEAENADLERGKDKEREAEQNFTDKSSEAKKYFEQYNEKSNFNEIIEIDEIQLNQFYKEIFNEYVNKVNTN